MSANTPSIDEQQMQVLCERYLSTNRLLAEARETCIERLGDRMCDGSSEPSCADQMAALDALTQAQATARHLYEECCRVAACGILHRIGLAASGPRLTHTRVSHTRITRA